MSLDPAAVSALSISQSCWSMYASVRSAKILWPPGPSCSVSTCSHHPGRTYMPQVNTVQVLGHLVRVVPVEPVPELCDVVLGAIVEERARRNRRNVVVQVRGEVLMLGNGAQVAHRCAALHDSIELVTERSVVSAVVECDALELDDRRAARSLEEVTDHELVCLGCLHVVLVVDGCALAWVTRL